MTVQECTANKKKLKRITDGGVVLVLLTSRSTTSTKTAKVERWLQVQFTNNGDSEYSSNQSSVISVRQPIRDHSPNLKIVS